MSSNGSERGVSPCSSEKLLSLSSAEDMTNSSNSTPVVKKLFSESLLVDPNDGKVSYVNLFTERLGYMTHKYQKSITQFQVNSLMKAL